MSVAPALPALSLPSPSAAAAAPDSEARWFLCREVFRSLAQVATTVEDCVAAFPALLSPDEPPVQESFVMQQTASQSGSDTAKCVLVLEGATIVQAELQVKIQKHPNMIHKTSIQSGCPWQLSQLRDSANWLCEARAAVQVAARLQNVVQQRADPVDAQFLRVLAARLDGSVDELMRRLKQGRDALLSPRKKTIEEHLSSANMRALQPPLPGDIAVSFYVQSARLTLAVYHLVPQLGSLRFDSFLAECLVPRLEQALAGYARAFQLCQQIKNKLFWAMSRCREGPRPAAPAAGLQNGVG